ncbi:MAG: phosphatidylglycerophosphatase A [Oleiphilaceae bacterium]|nr:phosphatidylglycerophosphatase A [Oleiphilaceae bacterium]
MFINLPRGFLRDPGHFLAFGLGSGCVSKAPGTFGTVMALLLYLPLQALPVWVQAIWLVISFVLGVWLCERASKALGVHDHGGIVWDEFVGYWLTMLLAPTGWVWLLYGFILFRLFDIWKPFPIRLLDAKVSGGFGIMIDDVLAGVYAAVLLQATAWLIS